MLLQFIVLALVLQSAVFSQAKILKRNSDSSSREDEFNSEPLKKSYTLVTNNEKKWDAALQFCNSIDMTLVSIITQEENDFLVSQIKLFTADHPVQSWWTSGRYASNSFQWQSKSKFSFADWWTGPDNESQPNNNKYGYCVELRTANDTVKWYKTRCSVENNFICERPK